MKRKRHRRNGIALMLAAVLLVQPMAVSAEEILRGTGDVETWKANAPEELQYAETLETPESPAGQPETEMPDSGQEVQEALDRAEAYLKANVTTPQVDTVNGEWSVLAMARGGALPESTKSSYLSTLYQTLEEKKGILHTSKYTEYSRVILALASMGTAPYDVAGYNLMYPLSDLKRVQYQGVNGLIFALIAADSGKYEFPELVKEELAQGKEQTSREKLLRGIIGAQLADGGWDLTGESADADLTAMALQALAPYYYVREDVKSAVDAGIAALSRLQNENGGFGSKDKENAESCAQAVIALSVLNLDFLGDERFVKNGHTALERLLMFQNADGSFSHEIGAAADAMATDKGTLALAAYCRAAKGMTSIYDMTDVSGGDTEQESEENILKFKEKLEAVPAQVTMAEKEHVYRLLAELDQMKPFGEKTAFRAGLREKADDIAEQEHIVRQLDEDIWNTILPIHITLQDKEKVRLLMQRYEALPEANKAYVSNRQDLFDAQAAIQKMEQENDRILDVLLAGKGGSPAESLNLPGIQQSSGKTGSVKEKTVLDAVVKDGVVEKEQFENIKGKDKTLRIEGVLDEKEKYTLMIYGRDVKNPMDMHVNLHTGSDKEEDIRQLAENPYMLHFEQEGDFPGEMLVDIPIERADGEYLLFYYHPTERKAEYIQKVKVENRRTKFIVSKGGDYFIDKRAKVKPLSEVERAEQEKREADIDAETGQGVEEELLAGTKQSDGIYAAAGLTAGILLLTGVLVSVSRRRKRKDKSNDEKSESK